MAWLYCNPNKTSSFNQIPRYNYYWAYYCLYNCIFYGWKKHIPLKSEKIARNSVKIISRSTCQKMSISISLVLQKRNITMKKKSSSALSNHKIVLFFTHHDFLFHFFFFLIFAIWKPFTLALKKWDWSSIKKNLFKFIKPQHGSFFSLTNIKLDHVIFPTFRKLHSKIIGSCGYEFCSEFF